MRHTVRTSLALAAAVLAGGCGADRLEAPDPSRPYTVGGPAERTFPKAGLKFSAPSSWAFDPGTEPLVATTSSGSATIAIWRYVRSEPLPREPAELEAAEDALEQAARVRDPSFKLDSARKVRVDGARAIELLGTAQVQGRERQVRSTHVYAKGAEVVVDTYAAPRDFPLMDRAIFEPLVDSLKIDPPTA